MRARRAPGRLTPAQAERVLRGPSGPAVLRRAGGVHVQRALHAAGAGAASRRRGADADRIGATDPAEAAAGTIRKLYAESKGRNAIHASDSDENAAREIGFFFPEKRVSRTVGLVDSIDVAVRPVMSSPRLALSLGSSYVCPLCLRSTSGSSGGVRSTRSGPWRPDDPAFRDWSWAWPVRCRGRASSRRPRRASISGGRRCRRGAGECRRCLTDVDAARSTSTSSVMFSTDPDAADDPERVPAGRTRAGRSMCGRRVARSWR